MRIVIAADRLLPGFGISRIAVAQAEALRAGGHDVTLLTGKVAIQTDVPIVEVPYSDVLFQADPGASLRALRELRPHIMHSHFFPMGLVGAWARRRHGILHVAHAHGISPWKWDVLSILNDARIRVAERYALLHADRVVAISRFIASELDSWYGLGPDRVRLCLNPVDPQFGPGARDERLAARLRGASALSFVSTGAMAPIKNQLEVVRAVARARQAGADVRLVVAGRTGRGAESYRKRVLREAEPLVAAGAFEALGMVPEEDLAALLASADGFVSATRWEGFGLPFVEAMASGIACVGPAHTSIVELLTESKGGIATEGGLDEGIARIALDEKLRRELGEDGRRFAQRELSREAFARRLEATYAEIA